MIWWLVIFGIGLLVKEFRIGVVTLVASLIVFSVVIAIGFVHNLFYAPYMAIKKKNWVLFFRIWWDRIDGTYATAGDIMYEFGRNYDILGNVWGEWIEDSVTTIEETKFGKKKISVSAALGQLEYMRLFMFQRGKKLSKVLNFVFREKRHAEGSWERYLALEELKAKNLKGKH